ncbi:hypothetical protein DFJ73DRAFT_852741, partial [Zopfochytrium polystomum]
MTRSLLTAIAAALALAAATAPSAVAAPNPAWVWVGENNTPIYDPTPPPAPTQSPPVVSPCTLPDTRGIALPLDAAGNPLVFNFDAAKKYCAANGFAGLVAETSTNQRLVSDLVSKIGSWNTDTYGGYPLFTMERTDGYPYYTGYG